MTLMTQVAIPRQPFDISYSDRLLMLGSCFAEEMGAMLTTHRFTTEINPFGTLYNPISVSASIQRLMQPVPYTEADLFFHDGLWHSWDHHGRFSRPTKEETLQTINDRLAVASEYFKEATAIIITFGSAYIYRLADSDDIVVNCHKMPDRFFVRFALTTNSIVTKWERLLTRLRVSNPGLKILFSVSPIRHLKDGAHGNQLSKATLLIAIDTLMETFPDTVAYFPAYEIMMDELRDYRFYAQDMTHPSPLAVEYIGERFRQSFFSKKTMSFYKEWEGIDKALTHRPNNPESREYRDFMERTLAKADELTLKIQSDT